MASPHDRFATLLPMPVDVVPGEGRCRLPRRCRVGGPADWVEAVGLDLAPGTGVLVVPGEPVDLDLVEDPGLAPEGYRLDIRPGRITIGASDVAGVHWAVATLRQLLPDDAALGGHLDPDDLVLPCGTIRDAPRFGWRGQHLDVARHFMPLAWLYRFVDLMAAHKQNVLHLHLNDDQGWRFEVKKWPKLTTVGASRPGTRQHEWAEHDGQPVGGFYSQEQLRRLVRYAGDKGISVVPEIDTPGHTTALLAAYPQFGTGRVTGVATNFDVFTDVLELTDRTIAMVLDVFGELLDVFPSRFIHIGGDECPRRQWRSSEQSSRLAADRGLDGVDQLQRWYTRVLGDWLTERGRVMVGWDEILSDGPVPDAVVMSWRGVEPGIRALRAGNRVVMAPGKFTYLDHYQSGSPEEPRAIGGGWLPWEMVAGYDPMEGIPDEFAHLLLGVQAQLWTEYMPDPRAVEYMAYPRSAVLSEISWRGRIGDPGFEARLRAHLRRLDAAGVNYRPLEGPYPWQTGGSGRRRRPDDHLVED